MSTNISMSKQNSQALPLNYFGTTPDGNAKHLKYLKIIWVFVCFPFYSFWPVQNPTSNNKYIQESTITLST